MKIDIKKTNIRRTRFKELTKGVRKRAPGTVIYNSQFGTVGVSHGAFQGWDHFSDLIKY
jgi:hypothetical protein